MIGVRVTSISNAPKPDAFDPNDSTPLFISGLFLIAALLCAAAVSCGAFSTALIGVDFEADDPPLSAVFAVVPALGLFVIVYAQQATALALAIGLLIWVHRVRKNLDALETQGLSFSAGWSVGAFFVPLLNLFLPVMVVGEVWRASAPNRVDGPFDWKNVPASSRVSLWWLAFLVGRGLTIVSDRVYVEGDASAERVSLWLFVGGNLFLFFAAFLGAWMVLSIRSRQRERFVQIRIAADVSSA